MLVNYDYMCYYVYIETKGNYSHLKESKMYLAGIALILVLIFPILIYPIAGFAIGVPFAGIGGGVVGAIVFSLIGGFWSFIKLAILMDV